MGTATICGESCLLGVAMKMPSSFFLILTIVLSSLSFAQGEESGKSAKDRVGPGKAVLAASEKDGLQLSDKAIKNFSLEFQNVNELSKITVPNSALVRFQDFTAVYRERNGWFRMIEIEPKIKGTSVIFFSKDVKPGDRIVIQNAGLIRVVELDVFGPEADACAD